MPSMQAELVERVLDEGQWFERGARVDFFGSSPVGRSQRGHLESAALGFYEVLRCARLEADGQRWLAVTLRPFGFSWEPVSRRS
jgi:hypothetical protein